MILETQVSVSGRGPKVREAVSYISCFSGIGGLEGTFAPAMMCEQDASCRIVLSRLFPKAHIIDDVRVVSRGSRSRVVVGGWPCQDLSVAGNQAGLGGARSALFYDFIKLATRVKAETIVGENVVNLIKMNSGSEFAKVLTEFNENGYPYVTWRVINAREFGLPHQRKRVYIIASKIKRDALSLHRTLPEDFSSMANSVKANGFYWTGGQHSICHSNGFVPTIKIGTGLGISSPPAVHYDGVVRKLSADEALRLQGFYNSKAFEGIGISDKYKMAGNAVPRPVGQFVVNGVVEKLGQRNLQGLELCESFGRIPADGFSDNGCLLSVGRREVAPLSEKLGSFLDFNSIDRLSRKACTGLLRRLSASNKVCPPQLFAALHECAGSEVAA